MFNLIQRSKLVLAAAVAVLSAVGCIPQVLEQPTTDFRVDDPALEKALRDAADEWARAGLEIANYVTINQTEDGVPVRIRPAGELLSNCNIAPEKAATMVPGDAHGCAETKDARFIGMWIADGLSAERTRLVVLHELVHFLVPYAEHLPDETGAVFSVNGTGNVVNAADMGEMARHTDVTLVHPW